MDTSCLSVDQLILYRKYVSDIQQVTIVQKPTQVSCPSYLLSSWFPLSRHRMCRLSYVVPPPPSSLHAFFPMFKLYEGGSTSGFCAAGSFSFPCLRNCMILGLSPCCSQYPFPSLDCLNTPYLNGKRN
ncbi:uncharacterized protein LOC144818472 [Lissotriton helveticus]